ncbi:MAG: hypothetical protein LC679_07545 [Intrasporangiaceae bacterium]|nr:hypothetical protein [Intrasporangiaceae bacterium]
MSATRMARCAHFGGGRKNHQSEGACRPRPCDCERPSSPSLPFFEDRSPGTQVDRCVTCGKFRIAHEYDPTRVRPEPVSKHPFVPMTEGYPYDSFYCGCWGWD